MPSAASDASSAIRIWSIRKLSESASVPTQARSPNRIDSPSSFRLGLPKPLSRLATKKRTSARRPCVPTQISAAVRAVKPPTPQTTATTSGYSHEVTTVVRACARNRLQPSRKRYPESASAEATMPSARTAMPAFPTPGGRASGTNTSAPETSSAPARPAAVPKPRMFESNTGRAAGRRAAKTTVASVTPTRATHAVTRAVTLMNATVPRPPGPRARVTSSKATKSPALPMTCAQKRNAEPRTPASGSRDPRTAPTGPDRVNAPVPVTILTRAAAASRPPRLGTRTFRRRLYGLLEEDSRYRRTPRCIARTTTQARESPSPSRRGGRTERRIAQGRDGGSREVRRQPACTPRARRATAALGRRAALPPAGMSRGRRGLGPGSPGSPPTTVVRGWRATAATAQAPRVRLRGCLRRTARALPHGRGARGPLRPPPGPDPSPGTASPPMRCAEATLRPDVALARPEGVHEAETARASPSRRTGFAPRRRPPARPRPDGRCGPRAASAPTGTRGREDRDRARIP